jgi:hypothetical protein
MVQRCPRLCLLCAACLHLSWRVQVERQTHRMCESQIDAREGIKTSAKVKHHYTTCILKLKLVHVHVMALHNIIINVCVYDCVLICTTGGGLINVSRSRCKNNNTSHNILLISIINSGRYHVHLCINFHQHSASHVKQ